MKKFFVIFFALFMAYILSGCVATTNLLTQRGALPDDLHSIAVQMVNVARRSCIRISGAESQSKDDWQKGRKLDSNDYIIRRFYVSDNGWYKANIITQGIHDELFYNKNTNILVCGTHEWGKYSDSSSIKFTEFGKIEKKFDEYLAYPHSISAITEFRNVGLTQLKYENDAKLCEDIKFAVQFFLTKDTKMDPTGLRLLRVSELTDQLSKFYKKDIIYSECGEKYFGK